MEKEGKEDKQLHPRKMFTKADTATWGINQKIFEVELARCDSRAGDLKNPNSNTVPENEINQMDHVTLTKTTREGKSGPSLL